MARHLKLISRISYLRTLIIGLGLDPKKFMLAVTYNAPSETTVYAWINTLYAKRISVSQAQKRIERAERLYKCYRNSPLTLQEEYSYTSAS